MKKDANATARHGGPRCAAVPVPGDARVAGAPSKQASAGGADAAAIEWRRIYGMRCFAVFAAVWAAWAGLSAQSGAELRLLDDGSVVVEGLGGAHLDRLRPLKPAPAQWSEFFAVYTGTEIAQGLPAVFGDYRLDGDRLRFWPRFPWSEGLSYTTRFSSRRLTKLLGEEPEDVEDIVLKWTVPARERRSTTRVEAVYPSTDELPMNVLRLYLHFTAPMSRGQAYDHIRLLNEEGNEVPLAFLIMKPELWDPDGRRFTLLFDPGRIKRGLEPHRQLGYPLQPERFYRLVVDPTWEDARGNPLAEGAEKRFRVGGLDLDSPDLGSWIIALPPAGTREPIHIDLLESLDRALLARLVRILDPRGNEMAGQIEVTRKETRWSLYPERPWEKGQYAVSAGGWLEDLAGNNLNRPFDLDLSAETSLAQERDLHIRPFVIP